MTSTTFSVADCGSNCGTALKTRIESLAPGDTLNIASGTYDVGATVWNTVDGTAGARIKIVGNPTVRPLIRGNVAVRNSHYVTIEGVRFQAASPGNAALGVRAGVGWTLRRCDVFGTSATGNFANMGISDDLPDVLNEPDEWLVSGCLFYDPFVTTEPQASGHNSLWHQIYITYQGTALTTGTIEDCIFVGHKSGSAIKLGSEGAGQPWGITIRRNTFYDGQTAIGFIHDARNMRVERNLFSRLRDWDGTKDAAIRLNEVPTATNTMVNNLGWDMGPMVRDVHPENPSKITDGGGNRIATGPPNFNSRTVGPQVLDGAGLLPNRFIPGAGDAYAYGVTAV